MFLSHCMLHVHRLRAFLRAITPFTAYRNMKEDVYIYMTQQYMTSSDAHTAHVECIMSRLYYIHI